MPNTNIDSSETKLDISSLSEFIKQETTKIRGRGIPPLDKWQPERCADMDMTIKANGEWWHEGGKIERQSLVDLFATILWREGSEDNPEYYLKTPVEKLRIQVEDVPFLIVDVNIIDKRSDAKDEPYIEFVSSTGDVIELNDEHPLIMRQYKGEDRPYIPVRFGMLGLISRSVLMHLVRIGELEQDGEETKLTLESGGKHYSISVPN